MEPTLSYPMVQCPCPSQNTQCADNTVRLALVLCSFCLELAHHWHEPWTCSLSLSTCATSSHVIKRNTNHCLPVLLLHQTLAAPWHISTHTTHPPIPALIPVAVAVEVPSLLTDPTPATCHLIVCRPCCSCCHWEAPPPTPQPPFDLGMWVIPHTTFPYLFSSIRMWEMCCFQSKSPWWPE